MSRSTIIGLCGLAALVSAGAARADEHPAYLPTRDVAVTYNLDRENPGAPKQAHMYYSAGTDRLRLETPGQKEIVIFDRGAKTTTVVMVREHIYFQTPLDPEMAAGFILNADMKFARGGTETIAGQRCTDWDVQSSQATGTVCVTDDGVLLLGRGKDKEGGGGGLQATEVSYNPQPPSLFIPPADFRKIEMSDVPGKPPK
jgi:hypothetical protein